MEWKKKKEELDDGPMRVSVVMEICKCILKIIPRQEMGGENYCLVAPCLLIYQCFLS